MSRVLVAMSGGVDSSVAAALLCDAGEDVVGVWMRLHDLADARSDDRPACCSLDAADDARRVAGQLGIPFYVLDLASEFDAAVIAPFVAAYRGGATPSPCIDCNTYVKFGALLGRARAVYGADAVATGHYARIEEAAGEADDGARAADGGPAGDRVPRRLALRRGADPAKDQSYFLYGLRQDQLARIRFPVGDLTKAEVREIADRKSLATARTAESQELCFAPGGDYRAALRAREGWTDRPGPILDADGRQVGSHAGIAGFTVGQRAGLGVALGEPRYVSRVDLSTGAIVLGRRQDLETRSIAIVEATWAAGMGPADGSAVLAQVRHRAHPVAASLRRDTDASPAARRWIVETEEPVWAAAPGQACVLYAGDEVLGGGRIARS